MVPNGIRSIPIMVNLEPGLPDKEGKYCTGIADLYGVLRLMTAIGGFSFARGRRKKAPFRRREA